MRGHPILDGQKDPVSGELYYRENLFHNYISHYEDEKREVAGHSDPFLPRLPIEFEVGD